MTNALTLIAVGVKNEQNQSGGLTLLTKNKKLGLLLMSNLPLNLYIGIDPGKSGSIAFIKSDKDYNKELITTIRFNNTESDVAWAFRDVLEEHTKCTLFASIEKVNSMPGQGVSSTFKFGQWYGFARGLLYAYQIPFEFVTPSKWQKHLGCLTKGDKNITKDKAQRLFPKEKIIHATADAILIAEYTRLVSF